jgi:signal transduction histidine kinase
LPKKTTRELLPKGWSENAQSLNHFSKIGDPYGQEAALNNMGDTYFKMKLFDVAKQHYEQSLSLAKLYDDLEGVAMALRNMATLQMDTDYKDYNLSEALRIDFPSEMPNGAMLVHADKLQLTQVFENLISNALKYTGEEKEIVVCLESAEM